MPRPGPTPGRLCGRKDGCRQPSPELRAVRQAGSISRPGEPSTQHPRIHRRPRLPRGGRTCPGVGGLPTKRWGTRGRPCRPCTLCGPPPGAGPGIEARSRASRPRDAQSLLPRAPATRHLWSPLPRTSRNFSGWGWSRGAGGWQEGGAKKRRRAGGPSLHPRARLGGKKSSPKEAPKGAGASEAPEPRGDRCSPSPPPSLLRASLPGWLCGTAFSAPPPTSRQRSGQGCWSLDSAGPRGRDAHSCSLLLQEQ